MTYLQIGLLWHFLFLTSGAHWLPSPLLARAHLYDDTPEVLTPCIEFPFDEYESLGCPVVVLFYSFWCHHCRTLAPSYKNFAIETNTVDKLGTHVFAVDCMKYGDACVKAGITSVPVLKFFDGLTWNILPLQFGNFTQLALRAPNVENNRTRQVACRAHRAKEVIRQAKRLKRETSTVQGDAEIQDFDYTDAFRYAMKYEIPPCISSMECDKESETFLLDDPFDFPLDHHDAAFQHRVYCSFRRMVLDNMPYILNHREKKAVGPKNPDSICSYTCGLWKLFHRLLQMKDGKRSLFLIRNYILTFFRCGTCRRHFAEMCSNGLNASSVFDDHSARIWLWRAHNQVNSRIEKALWPMLHNATSALSDTDILNFLDENYGSIQADTIKSHVTNSTKELFRQVTGLARVDDLLSALFRPKKKARK